MLHDVEWWLVQDWAVLPLKMGPIDCPETSVSNYESTLFNIPEERRTLIQFTFSINNKPNYTLVFIIAVIKEKYQSVTN
jgi:hypothetical protein